MDYASLGDTGLEVSRVAFGCAAVGGYDYGTTDDLLSERAVRAAIDAGITLFDTADVYGFGHAERLLGRALGPDRGRVAIATKCGVRWGSDGRTTRDSSPAYLARAVDASLQRLGVDCITLLQIHWPDRSTPIADTMGALERLREAGKVRFIGCCNFELELVEEAQRHGRLDSQQLPLSLGQREWSDCARACAERFGMAVLCYNTLAQGLFSGKFAPGARFPSNDLRSRSALFMGERGAANFAILAGLRDRVAREGRTTAQLAVRWTLAQPGVTSAIVGARSPDQVLENAAAVEEAPRTLAMCPSTPE